jgi:hypothetical protein
MHSAKKPTPQHYAALLDGELAPPAAAAVEAWLAAHPDAAAEVEGQRRVMRLVQDHPPPDPAPGAWDATLARVHDSLRPAARSRGRRGYWFGAGAAAAAAAALLLVRLSWPAPGTSPVTPPPPEPAVEVFPIATDDDIHIIRMEFVGLDAEAEARRVLAGRPPVPGALNLAGQEEVTVIRMGGHPAEDGRTPVLAEGDVPMIVHPQYNPRSKDH